MILGTAAYTDLDFLDEVVAVFGDRMLVSVDAREGKAAVSGWTKQTQMPADDVIRRLQARGVRSFVYSNIDRDGMLEGPDLDEVRHIAATVRGRFIYSGGIGKVEDLAALVAPAPGQPRGRDRRQGALRGALHGRRGHRRARRGLMHFKRIIPCLDVDAGRVVKGTNFVDIRDAGDPSSSPPATTPAAPTSSSSSTSPPRRTSATRSSSSRGAPPTRSSSRSRSAAGSARSHDAQAVLDAGADKVSINSAAVARPELVGELAERFGAQCVVLAIDAKRRAEEDPGWEVYVAGGRTATGLDAVEWAREGVARGAGEILLTSMDRDGTAAGYDLELVRAVAAAVDVPVIASGGVGTLEHLADGLEAGADAALVASIFHYGTHTVPEARDYLLERGVPLRPI